MRDRTVLLKLGTVKMRGGTIPEGRLLAARVSRDGARWMLSAQFESARPAPLEPTDTTVAIDLGVATLMTAFDGSGFDEVMAPKHLRKAQKRLRRLQRSLSRRKKGSARRRAEARRVGVMHRKVRDRRKDLLHQISQSAPSQGRCSEGRELECRGMVRNQHLALSVADAGMSRLVTLCEYKADWRGREVIKVDPWFASSQLAACAACGTGRCASSRSARWPATAATSWDVTAMQRRMVSRGAGEPGPKGLYADGDGRSGTCSGACQ